MPSTPSSRNFWLPPEHFKIAFFYRKIFIKCTTPAKVKFFIPICQRGQTSHLGIKYENFLVHFALSLHACCKFLVWREKKDNVKCHEDLYIARQQSVFRNAVNWVFGRKWNSIKHCKEEFSVKSRAHHNLMPSTEISVIGIMINLVISAFLKRYEPRSFMISNYLTWSCQNL